MRHEDISYGLPNAPADMVGHTTRARVYKNMADHADHHYLIDL
jgi:hypothetical protein